MKHKLLHKGGPIKSGIKQQVLKLTKSLPGDAALVDVMAELYFRNKLEKGLKELDQGKGISHKEVEKRMARRLPK